MIEEEMSGFQYLSGHLDAATSSGHVGAGLEVLYGQMGVSTEGEHLDVQKRLIWAGLQWVRSGMPIYRMEPELQDMLLNTELPDRLTELPHLPLPGLFLACDRFKVWNNSTGMHQSEGVYIVEDLVKRRDGGRPERGYMCISVGKSKKTSNEAKDFVSGKWLKGEDIRDDALAWGAIIPNVDLKEIKGATQGFEEGVRLAMNFLLLWNASGRHLEHKKVSPRQPPAGKKLKRFKRQHKSSSPFFLVTLRDRVVAKQIRTEISGWTGATHRVLVSGFWRRQWLKTPDADAQVVGRRTNASGTELCCVWIWISPHPAIRKGEASKTAKNFNVK